MINKTITDLYCVKCQKETEHTVTYLNEEIQRIKCMECGKVYGINRKKLLELYTIETAEYILEEPLKLNDELKKEGATFLLSLPKRIITKPYRIIKEFIELAKED